MIVVLDWYYCAMGATCVSITQSVMLLVVAQKSESCYVDT